MLVNRALYKEKNEVKYKARYLWFDALVVRSQNNIPNLGIYFPICFVMIFTRS